MPRRVGRRRLVPSATFGRFVARRAIALVFLAIGITLVVFLLTQLVPSDPVTTDLGQFIPATAELAILSIVIAILVGIPIGIVLFRALMSAMSPSEGADIVGTPGPLALVLILPCVAAVTALASSLPARSAARQSAAHVLRAE